MRPLVKLVKIKEMNMKKIMFAAAVMAGGFTFNASAWDYEGHHAVNELALASLPVRSGQTGRR